MYYSKNILPKTVLIIRLRMASSSVVLAWDTALLEWLRQKHFSGLSVSKLNIPST